MALKIFEGRLSRVAYIIKTAYILLGVSLLSGVLAVIFGRELFDSQLTLPLIVLTLILVIPITVRRLHDIGYPGATLIGVLFFGFLFPAVLAVFSLALFLWPSKNKENPY